MLKHDLQHISDNIPDDRLKLLEQYKMKFLKHTPATARTISPKVILSLGSIDQLRLCLLINILFHCNPMNYYKYNLQG